MKESTYLRFGIILTQSFFYQFLETGTSNRCLIRIVLRFQPIPLIFTLESLSNCILCGILILSACGFSLSHNWEQKTHNSQNTQPDRVYLII